MSNPVTKIPTFADLQKVQAAAVAEVKGAEDAPTTAEVKAELEDTARNLAGQTTLPKTRDWRMSNRKSAERLDALESIVGGPATVDARIAAAAEAQLALYNQQEGVRNTAQDARITSATTKADNAATAAATAANTATTASTVAGQAQSTATAAQTAAGTATTTANTAKATADAAAQAQQAFAARFKSKRVNTPAMLISSNPTVSVVWDTPFPSNNYTLQVSLESANSALYGIVPTVTAKTATGATVTLKILLALGAGAGTVHFTAIHD